MRYFLNLSYKGTQYHGWQVQQNANTVQEELNKALTTILRTNIETIGSGRTDAGVHALEQVAHFDFDGSFDLHNLAYKLNSFLPRDISVNRIDKVKLETHARFDAIQRSYLYRITMSKDPFTNEYTYFFNRDLDLGAMNALRPILLDWTDYECFSRVKTEVDHFLCDITDICWENKNNEIHFTVSANRFLRGMVRAMVGTMIEVGLERINISDFKKILESKDRRKAGEAVPAQGLFLQSITYPKDIYYSE